MSAELCCKLAVIEAVTPPIPLPTAVLNPAVIALINENITLVQAYIDAIPLDCPRNPAA